jgi:hypothetical protein
VLLVSVCLFALCGNKISDPAHPATIINSGTEICVADLPGNSVFPVIAAAPDSTAFVGWAEVPSMPGPANIMIAKLKTIDNPVVCSVAVAGTSFSAGPHPTIVSTMEGLLLFWHGSNSEAIFDSGLSVCQISPNLAIGKTIHYKGFAPYGNGSCTGSQGDKEFLFWSSNNDQNNVSSIWAARFSLTGEIISGPTEVVSNTAIAVKACIVKGASLFVFWSHGSAVPAESLFVSRISADDLSCISSKILVVASSLDYFSITPDSDGGYSASYRIQAEAGDNGIVLLKIGQSLDTLLSTSIAYTGIVAGLSRIAVNGLYAAVAWTDKDREVQMALINDVSGIVIGTCSISRSLVLACESDIAAVPGGFLIGWRDWKTNLGGDVFARIVYVN